MTGAPVAALAPVLSSSAAETRALGGALAAVVGPGDVVLLTGDLGAGKTTFAQGLAAALGVDEPVTSPTFTLVRSYGVPAGAGGARGVRTLLHADMYRLDRLHDVAELGLAEQVEDGAVLLVEWGDVAAPVLGGDRLEVALADLGETTRRMTLTWRGASWERRAGELAARLEAGTAPGPRG